jgi:hypothetical protein
VVKNYTRTRGEVYYLTKEKSKRKAKEKKLKKRQRKKAKCKLNIYKSAELVIYV